MARLAPDALLAQTNLNGAVAAIDDDPDAPDASWLTAADTTLGTDARVSFPTPGGDLSGSQDFRVQVRRVGGANNPTCSVELWENGALVSTLVASATITSNTGQVLAGSWDSTGRVAASIECRVVGTASGGSPSKRATVEIGAIEWNSTESAPARSGSASISGGGALAATGIAARRGAAAISGGGSVSASVIAARYGAALLSGGGVITATGSGSTGPIERTGSVVISGGGSVAATGRKGISASAAITAGGTITSTATAARFGQVALAGGGSIIAQGQGTGSQAVKRAPKGSASMLGVGR